MSKKDIFGTRDYYKPFSYPFAFEAYKRQNEIHWIPEEISLAEDVRDWNSKLTKSEKDFLTQIFRFFTQADCFSSDTEVLTDRGWMTFPDAFKVKDILVGTFDNSTNISFDAPISRIEKSYTGDMFLIKDINNRTEQLVTPNHKLIWWYKDEMRTSLVKDTLFYQGVKIKNSGRGRGNITRLSPMERLQIAFQADGSLKSGVTGEKLGYFPIYFSFKKQRKVERLEQILQECELEYEISRNIETGYTSFYIKCPIPLSKEFSWVDITKVDASFAIEFLDELSYWDSHIDEWGKVRYTNTRKEAVDLAQILAVKANIHHSYGVQEDNRSDKFNTVYELNYQFASLGEIDGQSIKRGMDIIPYSGQVYCYTMPRGTLITRRNNHVAFSGNCDIAQAYNDNYIPTFKHPELRMMLNTFAAMEAIHIDAYSLLIETVGMPESSYKAFHEYEEMQAKHEYFFNTTGNILTDIVKYSVFGEGLQLFASFAMLLNFPRFGKMKGMGQIVKFSIRDESLHVEAMTQVFKQIVKENKEAWNDELKGEIYTIAKEMVDLEDKFIDLAFSNFEIKGLDKDEIKCYIRYIADRRLLQIGLKPIFKVKDNPLTWLAEMLSSVEHTNFFENRVTTYAKGTIKGSFDKDVRGKYAHGS